jgi:hypothetical protein
MRWALCRLRTAKSLGDQLTHGKPLNLTTATSTCERFIAKIPSNSTQRSLVGVSARRNIVKYPSGSWSTALGWEQSFHSTSRLHADPVDASEEHQEGDPDGGSPTDNTYRKLRMDEVESMIARRVNPFPHTFPITISVPDFNQKVLFLPHALFTA